MSGTVKRAIIISLAVALVLPLAVMLLNGKTVVYKNGLNPKEFYSLTYEEQVKWQEENGVEVSGIHYLKEIINNPTLFAEWVAATITAFFVIFASCFFMAWWERKAKGV